MNTRKVFAVVASVLLWVSASSAASPEETFTKAVSSIKSSGTLEPLVDYVHWEAYRKKLGDQAMRAMGFSGASDIKKHYSSMAKSNGEHLLEAFKKEAKKSKGKSKVSSSKQIEMVRQELVKQQRELRDKLRLSVYTLSAVSGDDKRKTIKFTRSYDGQKSNGSLTLLPYGGGWRFESAAPLNPMGSGSASPIGSLPEPVNILFKP